MPAQRRSRDGVRSGVVGSRRRIPSAVRPCSVLPPAPIPAVRSGDNFRPSPYADPSHAAPCGSCDSRRPVSATSHSLTRSPSSVLRSSWMGTPGQCFASTRRHQGSISQKPMVSMRPVHAAASEKPPMPLQTSSIVHTVGILPAVPGLLAPGLGVRHNVLRGPLRLKPADELVGIDPVAAGSLAAAAVLTRAEVPHPLPLAPTPALGPVVPCVHRTSPGGSRARSRSGTPPASV